MVANLVSAWCDWGILYATKTDMQLWHNMARLIDRITIGYSGTEQALYIEHWEMVEHSVRDE